MQRVKINLAVFAVLATITIGWSVTSLFSIDRLERPYTISAQFESSPGLSPGFPVTYLGTTIGSVKSVDLEDGMSVIELKIRRDVELPAALDAAARRKSAIGEPYVDLAPRDGTSAADGPRLEPGAVIPLERTSVPISYAQLFASVDDLIDAVDPDKLQILLHETAVALDGRGDELRTLVVAADELTSDLVTNADEIDQFIGDLGTMAHTAATHRDSIETSLDSLSDLTASLSDLEQPINDLLAEAPPMVRLLTNIFQAGDASLLCTLDGLATLEQIVTPTELASLRQVLTDAPQISAILDDVITPDGYLNVDIQLGGTEGNPVIHQPRVSQPAAPNVPGCADFSAEYTPTGGSNNAGAGAGGDGAFPTDGTIEVPGVTDEVGVDLAGSSDLDEPDEPPLARIIGMAVPAAAVALLAAVAWFAYGLIRDRRKTG